MEKEFEVDPCIDWRYGDLPLLLYNPGSLEREGYSHGISS